MAQYPLLGISGSPRKEATNRKLVNEVCRICDLENCSIADLKLPLFDGGNEDKTGIPVSFQTLADQIKAADAVIISTPGI